MFLRQQMDSEGFIPAALIASFRRMQTLLGGATDIQTIVQAVQDSDVIEVKDGLKVSWISFEILPILHEFNFRLETLNGGN